MPYICQMQIILTKCGQRTARDLAFLTCSQAEANWWSLGSSWWRGKDLWGFQPERRMWKLVCGHCNCQQVHLSWLYLFRWKLAFEFYHRNIIKISPSALLLAVNDSQRFSSNKSYFPKSSHWIANTTSSLSDIHSSVHSHLPSWRQDSFGKCWMLAVYKALSGELWGSLPPSMPLLKFVRGSKAEGTLQLYGKTFCFKVTQI